MKCLSLIQPWATLVAIGAKTIETRSWPTKYRGPLAIHASKGFPRWCQDFSKEPPVSVLLGPHFDFPRGVVLATCELVDCKEIVTREFMIGVGPTARQMFPPEGQEFHFGNYSHGRYALILANVVALAEPVPAKGALGLWEWNQ
jgi:activating signal cointegrator 1